MELGANCSKFPHMSYELFQLGALFDHLGYKARDNLIDNTCKTQRLRVQEVTSYICKQFACSLPTHALGPIIFALRATKDIIYGQILF